MRPLFGDDFEARVELQRRQLFHHELLESARMESGEHRVDDASGAPGSSLGDRGRCADWSLLAKMGLILALVGFVYTIPAALLASIAAMPIATLLKVLAPRSSSFGEIYRMAAIAVFAYLCTTAVALGVVYALLDPGTRLMLAAQFLSAPSRLTPQSGLTMLGVFVPGFLVLWSMRRHR